MSQGEIMDRLEVQLPEDILQDLVEPGKTFQRDVSIGGEDSKKSQRPRIGLRLEKMADSLVKIFITTYKTEDDLLNTSMQTDQIDTEHSSIQTDAKKTGTTISQTDKCGTEESAMQTEKKQEKTQQQQTEVKSGHHKEQQTDLKEEKHQQQQTNITEYRDSTSQTTNKVFISTECQTVAKSIVERDCQTEIAEVKSHLAQTDLSMANLVDGCTQHDLEVSSTGCQAVVKMGEREIQATVLSTDSVSQTVIDTKTAASQAVVDIGTVVLQTELSLFNYTDMCSQTELDLTTQDCQTDSSIANLREIEVQAVVINSEIGQQTEIEQNDGCIQTDYLGESIETQTFPDVNSRETQTDSMETMPNIQDGSGMDQGAQVLGNEGGLEEPPNLSEEHPVSQGVDDPGTNRMDENVCEIGSQTDPVTIIIGDASFLVQKLKSASVNPAKVSGNEIEIEVGDGSDITQNGGPPEMHGAVSSPRTPQQQTVFKAKVTPKSVSSPSVNSPGRRAAMGRPRKLTQNQIEMEKRQVVGVKQAYVPKTEAIDASYSCPFCDMVFHESPTLYEHITVSHNDAMVKGHKKPKGREGKTIIPRGSPVVGGQQQLQQLGSPPNLVPQGVASVIKTDQYGNQYIIHEQVVEQQQIETVQQETEAEPPILEPMFNVPKHLYTKTATKKASKTYTRTVQQPEPSLFEDLPQPTRSYPRNRVKREGNDQDDEEETVPQPQIDAYEYECPHCPEKYGSASHLYTHLKRSHREDMEKNKTQSEMAKEQEDGAGLRKRKRVSAPPAPSVEEHVKKQRMSEEMEEGEQEEDDEVPGPEDGLDEVEEVEEIPTEGEIEGEEQEVAAEETGGAESVDEVAEEATEETTSLADKLPEVKAPTRKGVEKAHESAVTGEGNMETPPPVRRRGRPPKSTKKGSPAVTSESSPRVSGRAKRT